MGEYDFTLGIDLACSAAHVATLADAAGEFNRYNRRKVEILDEQAARMRIGGTFQANNVDAFARLLRQAYGVKVEVDSSAVKISA